MPENAQKFEWKSQSKISCLNTYYSMAKLPICIILSQTFLKWEASPVESQPLRLVWPLSIPAFKSPKFPRNRFWAKSSKSPWINVFNTTCLKWQFLVQARTINCLKTVTSKIIAKDYRKGNKIEEVKSKLSQTSCTFSITATWLDPLFKH